MQTFCWKESAADQRHSQLIPRRDGGSLEGCNTYRAIFEWLSFPLNESNYFLFSPFLLDSTGTNSGIERSDERNEGIVLRLFFPIASLEGVGRISNRSTTWLNKNPTQSYTDCRLNREHRLMMTV